MAFSSALVQEGVSRVSSYISTKMEDNVSNAHLVARLEMALSQLEFSLERTANLPITYISLLRRRKMLKLAYIEGTDLLKKHKLQLLTHEPQEQPTDDAVRRAVTHSSFPMLERIFCSARNLSVSSFLGLSKDYLSPSVVQIFERYADCAEKFVKDVESGCPVWHDTFRYPFERQLLEGKTLIYTMEKGSQFRDIHMWPVRVEGCGVVVELRYRFYDSNMPSKDFYLLLTLRLNQGTNIPETAIRCLQFVIESLKLLASQFKSVSESAMGEIALLSRLQDFTQSCGRPPFRFCSQETLVKNNRLARPDPICCTDNVVSSQPQSLHGVPEPVIHIFFTCNISAAEYMLQGSTDEIGGTNGPPLELFFLFVPHFTPGYQKIIVDFDGEKECISGSSSMQHIEELLVSKASDCFAGQPEAADCAVYLHWYYEHEGGSMCLKKLRPEMACQKPTAVRSSGRRTAKRKR